MLNSRLKVTLHPTRSPKHELQLAYADRVAADGVDYSKEDELRRNGREGELLEGLVLLFETAFEDQLPA